MKSTFESCHRGASSQSARGKRASVYFVGPFPPPVHGQAVSTAALANRLAGNDLCLIILNTSNASAALQMASVASRLLARVGSLRRHAVAAALLLFGRSGCAYISLNAYLGVILSLGLAVCAKIRGRRIFLHHHTYSHISKPTKLMNLLCKVLGPDSTHISPCVRMNSELRNTYPSINRTLAISNVFAVNESLKPTRNAARHKAPRLGHLSNLTIEKGLGRVIEAFRVALSEGLVSGLVVAGPCHDQACLDLIDASKSEFGSSFEYWGAIDPVRKKIFFNSIDIFLFPSLYSNETQGIVNLEALASGVAVCAFELCCIADDLAGPACLKVKPHADFSSAVVQYLKEIDLAALPAHAQHRFDQLEVQASEYLTDLRRSMIEAV